MAKVMLGEDLIPPLDKINPVLETLSPVKQQQVIEMLLVTHLYRVTRLRREQKFVMDSICKHVWQLLDQAKAYKEGPTDA